MSKIPKSNYETKSYSIYDPDAPLFDSSLIEDIHKELNKSLDSSFYSYSKGTESSSNEALLLERRAYVEDWIVTAPKQKFEDIIGNEEAVASLRAVLESSTRNSEIYEAYNLKSPKGALLFGPPGCGKTMFARAVGHEMSRIHGIKCEMILINASDIQSMYLGKTEENIRNIFSYAEIYKKVYGHPLLVFIDEADVLLPSRNNSHTGLYRQSQVATFLTQMDGIKESGAFVLLATNRPNVIDSAVLRDGRCDFKIEIKRPDSKSIEKILENSFLGIPIAKDLTEQDLVYAASDELMNREYILATALEMKRKGKEYIKIASKDMLLEHIVSGALLASIAERAKRRAFVRDCETNQLSGVSIEDVQETVKDIYLENKKMNHSYAAEEFMEQFGEEVERKKRKKDE